MAPTLTAQNPTADSSVGGAATSGDTAATSHSVVLPATVNPGDLLMVYGRVAAAGTVAVSGGGWTIVQDSSDASDDVTFWGYRDTLAAGSEDGTSITVTHGSAKMAAHTMAIGGAEDPAVQTPQSGTVAVGTTTTVNPNATTPAGGTKDYLWVWFGGWDGEQTLSKATPTNYTDGPDISSGTGGVVTTNVQIKTATRGFTASSEDPGACGTLSAAPSGWAAWTIAVHAPAPTFAQVASWFATTTPRTITGLAWSTDDVIVVAGAAENGNTTLATPTNANLTFSLQASQTDGASGESPVYIWTAQAGSNQTNQTISLTATGGGQFGFGTWILPGRSGSFANATANRTESAFSVTPTADSVVIYALADWSANTTDQTPTTATGTPVERVDVGNGSTYGAYLAEWSGVTASTASFGVTSYSGLQIGHAVLEALAAAGDANAPAGSPAAAGSAPQPTASVAPEPGSPAGAGTANAPTVNIKAFAGLASASGTAFAPVADLEVNAAAPASAGSAPQPTVTTGGASTNAPAGLAAATGTASAPTASVAARPAAPTGAGTANPSTASVGARPNAPVAAGTADGQTVQTGAFTNAPAGLAAATGTANPPIVLVRPNPAAASGTGSANPPIALVRPNAGGPAAAGSAPQPTVLTVKTAFAGLAAATGTANPPLARVGVLAGVATGVGQAPQPVGQGELPVEQISDPLELGTVRDPYPLRAVETQLSLRALED